MRQRIQGTCFVIQPSGERGMRCCKVRCCATKRWWNIEWTEENWIRIGRLYLLQAPAWLISIALDIVRPLQVGFNGTTKDAKLRSCLHYLDLAVKPLLYTIANPASVTAVYILRTTFTWREIPFPCRSRVDWPSLVFIAIAQYSIGFV